MHQILSYFKYFWYFDLQCNLKKNWYKFCYEKIQEYAHKKKKKKNEGVKIHT